MSKVVVFTNLSLDGVMQAPARTEEDPRDGFLQGGWALPYAAMQAPEARESLGETGALLLGRRTYEAMYDFWPKQTNNPITHTLNTMPKYIASTTLSEPLAWSNSTLLSGDASEALARLKQELDKDLMVMGSGELIQSLMRRNLVDKYVLLIHPLILGSGRRLFTQGSPFATLRLLAASTTEKGVVVATYEPMESKTA